jgi:hypothetical protein
MFSPGKEFAKNFQPSAFSRQVNPFVSTKRDVIPKRRSRRGTCCLTQRIAAGK